MRWLCILFLLAARPALGQLAPVPYVETTAGAGGFPLVRQVAGKPEAASLYIDAKDWPGVLRAAGDLQADIARVTDAQAAITRDPAGTGPNAVIIGTLGKSALIDALVKAGKIDTAPIAGKWESFFLQVVANPLPGIDNALVIVGSDKRGTIYGIYDLSEQIGISPWNWWADVPPHRHDTLTIKPGRYVQGEPSVKYRGIFINDEAPDLTNWITEKYGTVQGRNGVANYNSKFYAHIFELLLRLKGNYLWPAMWNNAFNEDDPENPRLADEYGIVMGTSHQEPMLRAQKEWDRRHRQSWNYYTDAQTLQDFWREGIRRNKNYESILTIGLRGANDTPMIPNATVPQSMDLLKQIIAAQRTMIAEEINADPAKVPQLWCPYKEVLDYYNAGLRVPDDVTILWTDDNWGNIRRLPTEDERKRPGGAGIYYHFDYVGGPRNYKWINTNPISKVWEQMSMAKAYGADRIWIVNVGHFKGLEFPIEYFMHLAWDTNRWTGQNINEYTRNWAEREFGPEFAAEIADIIAGYTKYNGRRKPELLEPTTYSQVHYQEADTVVTDFNALTARADAIYNKLPANQRDAFYELVLFPTKACAHVTEMYVAAGRNALYVQQGRASANDAAADVQRLFQADADLMAAYNHTLGDGKWNHFMDQVHIGYTIWQDPPRAVMPRVQQVQPPAGASMGVAAEGGTLPTFDSLNRQRHFIDVFRRGQAPFDFTAAPSAPWITIDPASGTVDKDQRLWVSIDWARAPQGTPSGTIRISRNGAAEAETIDVKAINPADLTRDTLDGFVESDGVVSIEAEHCTRNISAGSVRWTKIDDYGRTLSAMSILPMTAASIVPPAAAPCLEYRMYTFGSGSLTVLAAVAPSLNILPGRGLRYAVSFDDQPPQVITIIPASFNAQNGNREWETSVRDNCRLSQSAHTLAAPGYHTLKIWMVDPGVVLEKLVVNLGGGGGLKPSYLGPPESYHHSAAAP